MKKVIGIIGCGNMGSAIIKKVYGLGSAFGVVYGYDKDKKILNNMAKRFKVKVSSSAAELAQKCNIIILAVKPKDMDGVLAEIKKVLIPSKILISVAAGINTGYIEKKITKKIPVIRVMPNMPALVGAGISAVCKGKFAKGKDLAIAKKIFMNLGEVIEIDESLFDAVTAISGSGPAYFFYLVEILIKTGVGLGFKKEVAQKLAVETALGSAKALKETGESPEGLRSRVSSKGGTTEAAFKEFFKRNLGEILKSGIKKAFERSKCL